MLKSMFIKNYLQLNLTMFLFSVAYGLHIENIYPTRHESFDLALKANSTVKVPKRKSTKTNQLSIRPLMCLGTQNVVDEILINI